MANTISQQKRFQSLQWHLQNLEVICFSSAKTKAKFGVSAKKTSTWKTIYEAVFVNLVARIASFVSTMGFLFSVKNVFLPIF